MVFSYGEADGGSWVGLGKRGRERRVRHQATERGRVGKRLKRKMVEQRGERGLL
jgi:hypothetical protein